MQPKLSEFFLDENLPPQVARALALVGYPITHPDAHSKRGAKDPELITWLAQNQLTWITKDDNARKKHIGQIRQAGVSVVWVRGLEGRKNTLTVQQVHLLLTVRLQELTDTLREAPGPRHFMLYLSGKRAVLKPLQAESIQAGKPLRTRKVR
jgi:predicted nuclease of predicted toxin-antitoxin system